MKNLSDNRTCTKCSGVFPATAEFFYRRKDNTDGFRKECKSCVKHRSNLYYKQHKPECRQAQKQYYQTLNGYLHHIFNATKKRCTQSKYKDYKDYGGRGIKCNFASAMEFIDYITNRLGITSIKQIKGLEIDRIDNDGHYEPGNIRLVAHGVNMSNTRRQK